MRTLSCLLALAVLPVGGAASADALRLFATVGPGFTIELADADERRVESVRAGRYELVVRDRSDIHNFVLANKDGTGFRVDSGVEFVGDKTFTVDLVPGLYGYACSPHFETMNGRLAVLPPLLPPAPVRTLSALVGPSVKLNRHRVAPGRYRIVVRDRSRVRNFHLRGPGVNLKTGKTFMGSVVWTIRLAAGNYRWGSDPHLTGRLVVR